MNCVLDVAKKNQIHKIKLYTRKNFKAYDIYHHMGFEDQDDESVYLTMFFVQVIRGNKKRMSQKNFDIFIEA